MAWHDRSVRSLARATAVGTVFQVSMVIAGHFSPAVAGLFAVLGVTLSFLAGTLFGVWGRPSVKRTAAGGGAVAGGLCALLGIVISVLLGDVPAAVLAFGTASSAVTGALGGLLGQRLARSAVVAAAAEG